MVVNLYMSKNRYIAALKRIQDRIKSGTPLRHVEDITTGYKDQQCTWGLCVGDKESWPDAEDHLWPDRFLKSGLVAPLYLTATQKCPMDRRKLEDTDQNGCFYTCRVFTPKKGDSRINKDTALELYDTRIAEVDKS